MSEKTVPAGLTVRKYSQDLTWFVYTVIDRDIDRNLRVLLPSRLVSFCVFVPEQPINFKVRDGSLFVVCGEIVSDMADEAECIRLVFPKLIKFYIDRAKEFLTVLDFLEFEDDVKKAVLALAEAA